MAMDYPEESKRRIMHAIKNLGVLDATIVSMPFKSDNPAMVLLHDTARKTVVAERDRLEREIWARIIQDPVPWEDLR